MVANLTLPGDFAFQDFSNNSMVPENPSVINGRIDSTNKCRRGYGKYNMTYTELVQKSRDYTEVTSTVLTDTIINDFI